MATSNSITTLKTGDTWPYVEATLSIGGTVLDLTGCTVHFVMARKGTGEVILNKVAQIVGSPTDGKVEYRWEDVDTAEPGHFYGEFMVTFSSGRVTTVPNDQYLTVSIYKGLSS